MMRTIDEKGNEVTNPDLEKGHIERDRILVKHHPAEPEVPAVTEKVIIWQDENDPSNKLFKTVELSSRKPARDAWDEYEDVNRYIPYTAEELLERAEQKQADEQAQAEAEARAEEEAAKRAEIEQWLANAPEALIEIAALAAANEERLTNCEDALIEIASMMEGE